MAWWQEVIELVHQAGQVGAGDGDLAGSPGIVPAGMTAM
jgi:hypothetical protein